MKKILLSLLTILSFTLLSACGTLSIPESGTTDSEVYSVRNDAVKMYLIPNYGSYYALDSDVVLAADTTDIASVFCGNWEVFLEYAVLVNGKLSIALTSLNKSLDMSRNIESGGSFSLGNNSGLLWIDDTEYSAAKYISWYDLPISKRDEYVFEVDSINIEEECRICIPIDEMDAVFAFNLLPPKENSFYVDDKANDEISLYAEYRQLEKYLSLSICAITKPGYEIYRYGSESSLSKNVLSGPIITGADYSSPILIENSGKENAAIISTAPRGFARNRFLYATNAALPLTLKIPHITLQSRETHQISKAFLGVEELEEWQYKLETEYALLSFYFDVNNDSLKLLCDVQRLSDKYRLTGIDFLSSTYDMTDFNYQLDMLFADGFTIAVDKAETNSITVDITDALPYDFKNTYKLELNLPGLKYTIPQSSEIDLQSSEKENTQEIHRLNYTQSGTDYVLTTEPADMLIYPFNDAVIRTIQSGTLLAVLAKASANETSWLLVRMRDLKAPNDLIGWIKSDYAVPYTEELKEQIISPVLLPSGTVVYANSPDGEIQTDDGQTQSSDTYGAVLERKDKWLLIAVTGGAEFWVSEDSIREGKP